MSLFLLWWGFVAAIVCFKIKLELQGNTVNLGTFSPVQTASSHNNHGIKIHSVF